MYTPRHGMPICSEGCRESGVRMPCMQAGGHGWFYRVCYFKLLTEVIQGPRTCESALCALAALLDLAALAPSTFTSAGFVCCDCPPEGPTFDWPAKHTTVCLVQHHDPTQVHSVQEMCTKLLETCKNCLAAR